MKKKAGKMRFLHKGSSSSTARRETNTLAQNSTGYIEDIVKNVDPIHTVSKKCNGNDCPENLKSRHKGSSSTSTLTRLPQSQQNFTDHQMEEITEENLDQFHTVSECNNCPEDSACHPVNIKDSTKGKGKFICLCYHYKPTPLKRGMQCPRKKVGNGEDLSHPHQPISIVVPNSTMIGQNITDSLGMGSATSAHFLSLAAIIICICFSILSLVLLTVCLAKRRSLHVIFSKKRSSKRKREQLDIGIVGNTHLLLPTDRFVTNPAYDSPAIWDMAIRIFSPEEVKLSSQIGQGCFGKVFKGEFEGESVAVKVVKKEFSEEAVKEVETMATFSHPTILQLLGIVRSPDADAPWLVFEYMKYGDLASVLRNTSYRDRRVFEQRLSLSPPSEGDRLHDEDQSDDRDPDPLLLTSESLLDFSKQIAEGMKYLSSQHFVHRDLAARNCLVSGSGNVKISDFGLSRDVYTCDYYKIGGSRLLPLRWMAPESILYGRFTLESDVWAFGVLLWEIFSWGRQPYFGHSNEEVVQLILEGVLLCPPSDCPPIICKIMEGCWKTEPKDRLKFTQIHQKLQPVENSEKLYTNDGIFKECYEEEGDLPLHPKNNMSLQSWMESGYEVPRSILQKEYVKVV